MRPNRNYILVKINKSLQKQRREVTDGGILIPEIARHMQRNMQRGYIVGIGETAKKAMPEMQEGDIAIFHHSIESRADNLVDQDSENEYRVIMVPHANSLYGIIKALDGRLIPYGHWLFLHEELFPLETKVETTSDLILMNKNICDEDWYKQKMEETHAHIKSLETTMVNTRNMKLAEEIDREVSRLHRDIERMSNFINANEYARAKVLYASPTTMREFGVSKNDDVCIDSNVSVDVSVFGTTFKLVMLHYVYGIFRN